MTTFEPVEGNRIDEVPEEEDQAHRAQEEL